VLIVIYIGAMACELICRIGGTRLRTMSISRLRVRRMSLGRLAIPPLHAEVNLRDVKYNTLFWWSYVGSIIFDEVGWLAMPVHMLYMPFTPCVF
jgi:hypothetical protein